MRAESIDQSKFETIYNLYKDSVFQTALHYVKDHYTAEDIAQEAFFRYYVYMNHTKILNARAWLLTLTKNLGMNYIRDHKKELLTDTNEQREEWPDYKENGEIIFFQNISRNEMAEYAHTLLSRMYEKNEKWYMAVTLVYGLGKHQKEAAESMGITLDALQAMLRRAREWAQRNYREEFDYLNLI